MVPLSIVHYVVDSVWSRALSLADITVDVRTSRMLVSCALVTVICQPAWKLGFKNLHF